jgi:hypothetical protein
MCSRTINGSIQFFKTRLVMVQSDKKKNVQKANKKVQIS